MIAVTIGVGEKYGLLAALAADSCRKRTGLEVHILGPEAVQHHGLQKPHHLKFRLFKEFPEAETILYFDADTIFLKDFDPRAYANLPEFVCAHDLWDRGWVIQDARRVGIPPTDYFNSGFFILNRTHHQKMLETAECLLKTIKSPFKDQTVLNAARVQLAVPVRWLGKEFNYLSFQDSKEPERVVVGHMHGMANRPAESIRRFYDFWSKQPRKVGVKAAPKLGRGDSILRRLEAGQEMAGVEVGVFDGKLSAYLLGHRPELTLTMVDPWAACPPDARYAKSGDTKGRLKQSDFDRAYAAAMAATDFAKGRRVVMRCSSVEAAGKTSEHSLDFVFVDGDHTYDGTCEDIQAWLPKLKPGGWLCGHDFEFPGRPHWGVRKAVEEVAAALQLPFERDVDYTWFIRLGGA